MIKRITGMAGALCVVAIVVMTALNCGNYKSMLPEKLFAGAADAPTEAAADAKSDSKEVLPDKGADSLAGSRKAAKR